MTNSRGCANSQHLQTRSGEGGSPELQLERDKAAQCDTEQQRREQREQGVRQTDKDTETRRDEEQPKEREQHSVVECNRE